MSEKNKVVIIEDDYNQFVICRDTQKKYFDVFPVVASLEEFNKFTAMVMRFLEEEDKDLEEVINGYGDISAFIVDYELKQDSEKTGIFFCSLFDNICTGIIPVFFLTKEKKEDATNEISKLKRNNPNIIYDYLRKPRLWSDRTKTTKFIVNASDEFGKDVKKAIDALIFKKKIKFNKKDLKCIDKTKKVKVVVAQPDLTSVGLKSLTNVLFEINETDDYKKYINVVLEKAKDEEANLIVFPELCMLESLRYIFEDWTKRNNNVVVIAGSCYWKDDGKYYNIASIFFNGERHTTEKLIISPLEYHASFIDASLSYRTGHQNYFINAPFGNIGLLICSDISGIDNVDLIKSLKVLNLDVLTVIAFQKEYNQHWNIINTSLESDTKIPFCIYCNPLITKNQSESEGGGSALFANEYKNAKGAAIRAGFVTNDPLSKKQLEMPSGEGGALVASFDLEKSIEVDKKDYDRALFNEMEIYLYKNGCLSKYTKDS